MNTTIAKSPWLRFVWAPLILRGYIIFVLVATTLSFSGTYAPSLDAALVPYTGWSGLSYYMFTLYFAISAILTPRRKPIYGVAALLGLAMIFGIQDAYQHMVAPQAGAADSGNPYLIYNPYRPIFTILLPAAWIFLLLSPIMTKWMKATDAYKAQEAVA